MKKLLCFLFLYLLSSYSFAQPTSCASEASLQGRSDVLLCEPFESSTWYLNYFDDGSLPQDHPVVAKPRQSSVVTAGCIGGKCLRVNCNAWNNGGCGGAVVAQMPIPGNQDEVYLRYYMRLGTNWTPANICASTSLCGTAGAQVEAGGKFPGLADPRTNADPATQCGNGGARSDGINCWSARAKYDNCLNSQGVNICQVPNATTRFGYYWYLDDPNAGNGEGKSNQAFGNWDTMQNHSAYGPCATDRLNVGSYVGDASGYNTTSSCGIGDAGLVNDRWYRIEMRIKMNTPGVADGIAEGWIDGVLKYRKTNILYRYVGHDNLHVRNVWFELHAGGEGVGPPNDTYVLFDQLVVATKPIGAFGGPPGDTTPPAVPKGLGIVK